MPDGIFWCIIAYSFRDCNSFFPLGKSGGGAFPVPAAGKKQPAGAMPLPPFGGGNRQKTENALSLSGEGKNLFAVIYRSAVQPTPVPLNILYRNTTICARMQGLPGSKVVSVAPSVIFIATAHATALV